MTSKTMLATLTTLLLPASALAWGHHYAPALPIYQLSGHYEGSLTTVGDGGASAQVPVAADLTQDHSPLLEAKIRDGVGGARLTLEVSAVHGDRITVDGVPGLGGATDLSLQDDNPCFTGGTANRRATLCATADSLSLEVQATPERATLLSLVLHHFSPNLVPAAHETPEPFTLTQAIEHARKQSFSTRIEFEHVIQAKAQAKAAYLHLLPQITLSTVASNVGGLSFSSILGAIGDLAPFLLPDRWLQARAAADLSRSEHDTDILMRLSVGAQVEGLFYAYARDLATRDLTRETLDRATGIRNEVRIRENLGQLPQGSSANMDSIVNQIQQTLTILGQVVAEDLGAISQTLGFYDPGTVTGATIDAESVPIDHAPAMDYATINDAALKRSFELDQMDDLIAAAQANHSAQYFSWLDPYGDPSLGLGLALHSQLEVSRSQIRELGIDKQQLQSILSQKVYNAVTDYGQAVQSYQLAKDGMVIQNTRLSNELNQLHMGANIDFFGLLGILQDYLSSQIQIETSRANYRVARSEIDRLLLQGYYSRF